MSGTANGNNGNGNGRKPGTYHTKNGKSYLSHKYGRPAYPFYGIYSNRRTPPWLLIKQLKARKSNAGRNVVFVFAGAFTLVALAVVAAILLVFGTGTGAAVAGYNYYARGLSLDKEYALTFETTRIYDRNGVLLYEKQPEAGARDYIPINQIPKTLIDATVATEDPTFFENQGVDLYAVARAFYINASGRGSSGASTITQQVARLLYLPPNERYDITPERKIREMILATMLTEKFTKEQIMEKYLNQIYYGNLAYGIEAAAEGYFGKHAKDLTLPEASMLAGLPQAPSEYDPTINYDLARQRQKIVLDLMVKYNKITDAEAQQAYSYDIKAHLQDRRKQTVSIRAPHFVNWLIGQFSSEDGLKQLRDAGVLINPNDWEQGGYDIYTTVDVRLVEEAEQIARKRIEDLKKQKASNAALVAMQPSTGEILAMVGSVDFYSKEIDGQYNAAVALRQPGSSIKPVTYAAAMTKGWNAATVIADVPTTFPSADGKGYTPQNFNFSYAGPVPVRTALGSSLNIPAVKTLQFAGIQYMMDLAKDLGIQFQKSADFYGLPLTLGGGEVRLLDLVGAYTVFDNQGKKIDPVSILKVTRHDKTLYEFDSNSVQGRQVLSPQISYVITDILSDNNARLLAFSRQNPLVLSRPAAAKTGTTNDFKDSWTVGYTPDLVTGVWIGNNDNTSMLAVAGSVGGGNVWHDFMEKVYSDPNLSKAIQLNDKPLQKDFTQPSGLRRVTVCVESGLLPNSDPKFDCPEKRAEWFPESDVPKTMSTLHQRVKVPKPSAINNDSLTPPDPGQGNVKPGDPTYCIADDSYPPDQVVEKLFYNYPPELKQWGISKGRMPPPTQPCSTYVPPTPTPEPSPSPDLSGIGDTPVPVFGSPAPLNPNPFTAMPGTTTGGANPTTRPPTPTPSKAPATTPKPPGQPTTKPPG